MGDKDVRVSLLKMLKEACVDSLLGITNDSSVCEVGGMTILVLMLYTTLFVDAFVITQLFG
tara:strand:+ start:265 stop:447 length:183 start_codon:yes stop_codon:yes gene_type:complete